jgi:hypothetical protein
VSRSTRDWALAGSAGGAIFHPPAPRSAASISSTVSSLVVDTAANTPDPRGGPQSAAPGLSLQPDAHKHPTSRSISNAPAGPGRAPNDGGARRARGRGRSRKVRRSGLPEGSDRLGALFRGVNHCRKCRQISSSAHAALIAHHVGAAGAYRCCFTESARIESQRGACGAAGNWPQIGQALSAHSWSWAACSRRSVVQLRDGATRASRAVADAALRLRRPWTRRPLAHDRRIREETRPRLPR